MSWFAENLQSALYDRLSGYTPLTAVAAVYDHVPQSSTFPYVTIGEDVLTGWSGDDFVGAEGSVTVHTWSRHRGRVETKQIQGHLFDALSRFELPIAGVTLVTLEFAGARSQVDTDGRTRHGITEFDVIFA